MFLVSIERDMKKWQTNNNEDFYSPKFDDYVLSIDNAFDSKKLYLIQGNINHGNTKTEVVLRYGFLLLIFDFEVWWSVRKMKKYFVNLDKKKEEEKKNMFLISGLIEIEKSYIKDVRKEKLKEINK